MKYIRGKEHILADGVKILDFRLENVMIEEANALRRTILTKIPVLGIGNAKMIVNESSFPTEMVVKRLMAVYLKNSPGLHERQGLKFEIECPANSVLFDVESQMIEELRDYIMPRMLIVSLKPGQRISIVFDIVSNISRIHNAYSAVSTVGFKLLTPVGSDGVDTIGADKTYEMSIETTSTHEPDDIIKIAAKILHADFENARVPDGDESVRVTKIDDERIVVFIINDQYTLSQTIAATLMTMSGDVVFKAGAITPDQLLPNSEVHIQGSSPLESYHKAIDIIQDRLQTLIAMVAGKVSTTSTTKKSSSKK
jgi:DNA-directed RNA polymerase subunit L